MRSVSFGHLSTINQNIWPRVSPSLFLFTVRRVSSPGAADFWLVFPLWFSELLGQYIYHGIRNILFT